MGDVFTTTRPLRFADCDPAGIAFYPRLLEHLNGVVEDWFGGPLQCSYDELHRRRHKSLPTVEMNVKFLNPGELGDRIEWQLSVKALGRSSMTLSITATRRCVRRWLRIPGDRMGRRILGARPLAFRTLVMNATRVL